MKLHEKVVPSPEVAEALREGRPVVALESTIISHGMPRPSNLETARAVEAVVREGGAVPATIGIIDGTIRVGLTDTELEDFAKRDDVTKVSRRDLPLVLAAGGYGATTVAATMICANLAGIRIFVTGGIGGVHRGGEDSMDVSADLTELARTSVAVVCAGAKAILDIGRTLEFLETHGVPVLGYRSDDFPAFYSRTSGFGVDRRYDDPESLAEALALKWELGLEGGVVVGNPVPQAHAMDAGHMEFIITQALADAATAGVKGKDVTPFLLDKVKSLTAGKSLETNIALIKHNAQTGAALACALTARGSST